MPGEDVELGPLVEPFPAYYRASDKTWEDAYASAVFVLDANALLDLYRLSPGARIEYLAVLRSLKDRLFVPYQVALEFHRRRADAVASRIEEFETQRRDLSSQFDAARGVVNQVAIRSHGGIAEGDAVVESLRAAFDEATTFVAAAQMEYDLDPDRLLTVESDPVLRELQTILDGRVARRPDHETLEADEREGYARSQAGRPPGHKDAAKADGGIGDYLWWAETLRYLTGRRCPLVVVTNEVGKGDWMLTQRGFRMGLLPELVGEARAITGSVVLTRTSSELLGEAAKYLDVAVSERTVDEASTLPTSLSEMMPNRVPRRWVHTIVSTSRERLDEWTSEGLLPASDVWEWSDVRRAAVLAAVARDQVAAEAQQSVLDALSDRPQGRNVLVRRGSTVEWVRRIDLRRSEQEGKPEEVVFDLKGVESEMRRRQGWLRQQASDSSKEDLFSDRRPLRRQRWIEPAPGEEVIHDTFGRGIVESVSGEGDQAEALVRFETVGEKRLLLAWAPIRLPGEAPE